MTQTLKHARKRSFLPQLFHGLGYVLLFLPVFLFWELLLYAQINEGLADMPVWVILFVLPTSLLAAALCGWTKNRKLNRFLALIPMALMLLYYLIDLTYFEVFGSLVSLSTAGNGAAAIADFGAGLIEPILSHLFLYFLFILPLLLGILWAWRGRKGGEQSSILAHLALLLAVALLFTLLVVLLPLGGKGDQSAYKAFHSRYTDTDSGSRRLGAFANTVVELKSMMFDADEGEEDEHLSGGKDVIDLGGDEHEGPGEASDPVDRSPNIVKGLDFAAISAENASKSSKTAKKVVKLADYFNTVTPTNRNEYTGMFKGYNLIYICAESFSNYALDERVTPTLCRMAKNGIVLKNYYNSFKNTTTNGEFSFLSAIWPDVSRAAKKGTTVGSMPQSAKLDMFPSLGNMMNSALGIQSRGYHNFRGSYYARNESLPNMGFECKFMNAGMKFTTAWPSSDLEMMQQSVDDYINDEQFCAYYMTFSGHGPYTTDNLIYNKNIKETKQLLGDSGDLSAQAIGYYAGTLELEKAMVYLLQRLEEAGQLEKTVIVLTGDHYPYYLSTSARTSIAGETVDTNFDVYHSTCIMYNAGMEEPLEVEAPCCNVDILPTILNLFGVEYDSRLYAGRDILSDTQHMAILYNKSFITDKVRYNADKGKAEWLVDTSVYTEEQQKSYLDSCIEVVAQRYSSSLTICECDFYQAVTDYLKKQ